MTARTRFIVKLAVFILLCVVFVGGVFAMYTIEYHLPVNINTASAHQLQRLDGMTAAVAESILDYREESVLILSVEELLNVEGVTSQDLDRWRPRIIL